MAIIDLNEDVDNSLEVYKYKDINKIRVEKNIEISKDYKLEDLSKGEYETFMLKEIYEQPATIKATMLGRIDPESFDARLGGLIDSTDYLKNIKNILFTACGTAYNSGLVASYIIENMTDIICRNEIASEGKYKKNNLDKESSAVFVISQSGETADTLEYVKELNNQNYKTFGIINVVGSAIAKECAGGVYTRAGTEVGVASTKAFTSQLVVMYLLALYFARKRGMNILEDRKSVV